MKTYLINLYKGGKVLRVLEVRAETRHHAEAMAREAVNTTEAEAMGAVAENGSVKTTKTTLAL